MLVPWRSLNERHKDTAMCRSGAERKRSRDTEAEIRESAERDFEAYGGQLELVTRFTYLGRVMTAGDDDWPEVAGNLKKARKSWGRLRRILGREGATARISGAFFVTRFNYLGRVMTAVDDDWPAVAGNLAKARRSWGRLGRILGRERERRRGYRGLSSRAWCKKSYYLGPRHG